LIRIFRKCKKRKNLLIVVFVVTCGAKQACTYNYVVKLKILREKMERICQNIDALNKMRLKLKKKKIW
jgi:hypothetical protein